MNDNIKLPPMPKPHTLPVFATAANTPSVKAGYELGGYEKTPPLFDEHQLEAYAREAVRLNAQAVPGEPDWRHPKIQGLIGSEARLRIAIDLIWQILEDPNQEFTASDMEYWDTIHDKLKAALSAAPAAQAVPQGWVMVPKEPTPEMLQIGRHAAPYRAVDVYRAMLAAAPAAPQPAQPLTDEQANCWCESCDLAKGDPCGRTRMSICPNCGDKRCPRAKHHDNECQQANGIGVKND